MSRRRRAVQTSIYSQSLVHHEHEHELANVDKCHHSQACCRGSGSIALHPVANPFNVSSGTLPSLLLAVRSGPDVHDEPFVFVASIVPVVVLVLTKHVHLIRPWGSRAYYGLADLHLLQPSTLPHPCRAGPCYSIDVPSPVRHRWPPPRRFDYPSSSANPRFLPSPRSKCPQCRLPPSRLEKHDAIADIPTSLLLDVALHWCTSITFHPGRQPNLSIAVIAFYFFFLPSFLLSPFQVSSGTYY